MKPAIAAGQPHAELVAVEHDDQHHEEQEAGRTCTGKPSSCSDQAVADRYGSVDSDGLGAAAASRRLDLVPYVYAFDHKHRRPPMEYKDLLGGKGANLAEMTSVLKLPVPPGFTISTDACRAYMDGGWPAGLDDEIAKQVAELEKQDGPPARRPRRPAARQRALGRQVLDAGDDGHRPQPRAQRPAA